MKNIIALLLAILLMLSGCASEYQNYSSLPASSLPPSKPTVSKIPSNEKLVGYWGRNDGAFYFEMKYSPDDGYNITSDLPVPQSIVLDKNWSISSENVLTAKSNDSDINIFSFEFVSDGFIQVFCYQTVFVK